MTYLDAVKQRVESDRASRISANQVSLDRGVNLSVGLYASDRDAAACRVDNVARTGCGATNRDCGSYLRIDCSSRRTHRCRSRSIRPEIIALHQRVVAVVQYQGESTVACNHVARRRRCAADNAPACASVSVDLNGGAVTNDRCAICIHAKKIPGHNIVVTAHEYELVVRVACKAESFDSGTGTIARQSASRARTKADHLIAGSVADNLDPNNSAITDRERVRACARLGVAVDHNRLTESETEVARPSKAISERDSAHVRRRVATRIAGWDVELDQVRRAHWRRIGVRRINRLP